MDIHSYAIKDARVEELFFHVICNRNVPVTLRNSSSFLHLVFNNSQVQGKMSHEMSVLTSFEAQLHRFAMVLMSRRIGKKMLNIIRNPVNRTHEIISVQLLKKAWDALKKSFLCGPLCVFIEPDMYVNLVLVRF